MKPSGKPNPSQYHGTLKDTRCTKCGTSLNNLTRIQQDRHELNCAKQEKLFG